MDSCQKISTFFSLLEEAAADFDTDFPSICLRMGAVPADINALLLRETGLCGEEIAAVCRNRSVLEAV